MAKSFYHLQKKKEFASEELEKIKEEINEYCKDFLCTPQPEVLAAEINKYIIDKHISRLKGEQEE